MYLVPVIVVLLLTKTSTASCQYGYFVYKIPAGLYYNEDGSDQSVYPGTMCRACSICNDGVAIINHCSQTNDTVCGEKCLQKDYVFDEWTKSCQPEYIVKGRDKLLTNSYELTEAKVDVLFICAATVLAFVSTFTVAVLVLYIVCMVRLRKQRNVEGTRPIFD